MRKRLARDGMTMLLVTHEMGLRGSSPTACSSWFRGHIAEEGPPDEDAPTVPREPRTAGVLSKGAAKVK